MFCGYSINVTNSTKPYSWWCYPKGEDCVPYPAYGILIGIMVFIVVPFSVLKVYRLSLVQ